MERQRENLNRQLLRVRQRSTSPGDALSLSVGGLLVDGHRIVDGGPNASGLEPLPYTVALGNAHDVKVIDMAAARSLYRLLHKFLGALWGTGGPGQGVGG